MNLKIYLPRICISRVVAVLILGLIATCISAQGLIPFKKGNKWGYANYQGELIIDAKYHHAGWFNQGYAAVHMKPKDSYKRIGYINKDGVEMINPIYRSCKEIGPFIYRVQGKNHKYGVVRPDANGGRVILPLDHIKVAYDYGQHLIEAWRPDSTVILCDIVGNITRTISKAELLEALSKNSKYNPHAKAHLQEIEMDEIVEVPPSKRIYPKVESFSIGRKKGVIVHRKSRHLSNYGNIVQDTLPALYDEVDAKHHFKNCFVVRKKKKWGAVSLNNEIIIPIDYEKIDVKSMSFQGFRSKPYKQTFIVKTKKGWGVIGNKNKFQETGSPNEILIPFKYDGIERNVNHSAYIIEKGGKYGMASASSKIIKEPSYHFVDKKYKSGKGIMLFITKDKDGNTKYVGSNGVEFWKD